RPRCRLASPTARGGDTDAAPIVRRAWPGPRDVRPRRPGRGVHKCRRARLGCVVDAHVRRRRRRCRGGIRAARANGTQPADRPGHLPCRGLSCGAAGATLVALSARSGNVGLLLVATVPIGFTALAMPAMTGLAMRRAPKFGLGLSAGVFNTSRQAGGALGVAVLGAVL